MRSLGSLGVGGGHVYLIFFGGRVMGEVKRCVCGQLRREIPVVLILDKFGFSLSPFSLYIPKSVFFCVRIPFFFLL